MNKLLCKLATLLLIVDVAIAQKGITVDENKNPAENSNMLPGRITQSGLAVSSGKIRLRPPYNLQPAEWNSKKSLPSTQPAENESAALKPPPVIRPLEWRKKPKSTWSGIGNGTSQGLRLIPPYINDGSAGLRGKSLNAATVAPSKRPDGSFLYPHSMDFLAGDFDYCSLPCGKRHVGCRKNNLKPAPGCPENPDYNSMQDFKDLIIDFHNMLRNEVAGGLVNNLPQASRMGTMEWDHDLHVTATFKAQLCVTMHDTCHGTKRFHVPGQNIGGFQYGGRKSRITLEKIVLDTLQQWAKRSDQCNRDIIKSFPPFEYTTNNTEIAPEVGSFTVMVREGNNRIGCGINQFEPVHNNHHVILVCHYASTNFVGISTYKEGAATSDCKTGNNAQYPNLCSPSEIYHLDEILIV